MKRKILKKKGTSSIKEKNETSAMWKAGKQIKSFSNKTGFTKRGVHTLPESQDASKNLVVLQYEDLKSKNLFEKIEKAFGREGLGALTIRGIPVRFFPTILLSPH